MRYDSNIIIGNNLRCSNAIGSICHWGWFKEVLYLWKEKETLSY